VPRELADNATVKELLDRVEGFARVGELPGDEARKALLTCAVRLEEMHSAHLRAALRARQLIERIHALMDLVPPAADERFPMGGLRSGATPDEVSRNSVPGPGAGRRPAGEGA